MHLNIDIGLIFDPFLLQVALVQPSNHPGKYLIFFKHMGEIASNREHSLFNLTRITFKIMSDLLQETSVTTISMGW